MKSLQWLLAGLLMLACTGTLLAQNAQAPAPAPKSGVIGIGTVASIPATTGGVLGFPGHGVKGIPFSADIVNEFTQVLADGNRIHRETHGATYRDAEGRTRNENEVDLGLPMEPRTRITINDPVAGTIITMYAETKTAVINHFQAHPVYAVGAGYGSGVGAAEGKSPTELLEELKKVRADQGANQARTRHEEARTEQLGKKEIEGVTASGTRHIRTMDAGAIGNDRPITSTFETWFSEDLKMVILSVNDNPQSGQRTMRLTNIRLGDPDPQLFQIPADYTVRDVPLKDSVVIEKPPTSR